MLVILRENIENLGSTGDVVKVSNGYARNFLLPRHLVVAADETNVAAIEHHKRVLEKMKSAQKAASQAVAQKLEAFSCTIARKVGEHDKLFGSVTSGDISDALKKAGFLIDKKSISLGSTIKTLGVHPVTVKLEGEVVATLKVWVVKEE